MLTADAITGTPYQSASAQTWVYRRSLFAHLRTPIHGFVKTANHMFMHMSCTGSRRCIFTLSVSGKKPTGTPENACAPVRARTCKCVLAHVRQCVHACTRAPTGMSCRRWRRSVEVFLRSMNKKGSFFYRALKSSLSCRSKCCTYLQHRQQVHCLARESAALIVLPRCINITDEAARAGSG